MSETYTLKEHLGPAAITQIGHALRRAEPSFASEAFARDACTGLDALELKARVAHVVEALEAHLPRELDAALSVRQILKVTDFISIGTNDLIQYLLAVDRANENVAHLYQPFHPAILAVLKLIFDAAAQANKPVAICGELGGDPMATALLLGLGNVHELSMDPHSIPKVKKILRELTLDEARQLADKALALDTAEEIDSFIREEMRKRFPYDFDRDSAFGEKTA